MENHNFLEVRNESYVGIFTRSFICKLNDLMILFIFDIFPKAEKMILLQFHSVINRCFHIYK